MIGLIIKAISGEFTVSNKDNFEMTVCKPRGNMSYNENTIKVGDYVEYEPNEKVITKVLKRKNTLVRPLMSNIDKILVITSVKEPDLNLYLLDKMLAIYEYYDITPIIVFSKVDLLSDLNELNILKEYYTKIGYHVYYERIDSYDLEILKEIDNNICAVSGQSGVGKSSLINNIMPSLNLKTGEISNALGRGKHTTRHSELFRFQNGWIADAPGFGNIDFFKMDTEIVSDLFIEFKNSRQECKYNNCTHINEPHCSIKERVSNGDILKSRYDNYLRFIEEVKEFKNKY